jgi:exonuclease III
VACINIRGSTYAATDIQCILHDSDEPDVLVLTETKRRKPQFMRRDIGMRYTTYHSTTSSGNAGVMMLLHRKYAKVGAAAQQAVPKECRGYILHATVGMPYTATLHLVGVYLPCDEAHAHMRPLIYDHLSTVPASFRHRHPCRGLERCTA